MSITVKELNEKLIELVENGKGDYKIVYDSYVKANNFKVWDEDKEFELTDF